jgi:hypothetical protein
VRRQTVRDPDQAVENSLSVCAYERTSANYVWSCHLALSLVGIKTSKDKYVVTNNNKHSNGVLTSAVIVSSDVFHPVRRPFYPTP